MHSHRALLTTSSTLLSPSVSSVAEPSTPISCSCGPTPECRLSPRAAPPLCCPLVASVKTTWRRSSRRRAQPSSPQLASGMTESFYLKTPERWKHSNQTSHCCRCVCFLLISFLHKSGFPCAGSWPVLGHHQAAAVSALHAETVFATFTCIGAFIEQHIEMNWENRCWCFFCLLTTMPFSFCTVAHQPCKDWKHYSVSCGNNLCRCFWNPVFRTTCRVFHSGFKCGMQTQNDANVYFCQNQQYKQTSWLLQCNYLYKKTM